MSEHPDPSGRRPLTAANAGELVEHLAVGTAAGLPLDEIFLRSRKRRTTAACVTPRRALRQRCAVARTCRALWPP